MHLKDKRSAGRGVQRVETGPFDQMSLLICQLIGWEEILLQQIKKKLPVEQVMTTSTALQSQLRQKIT